MSLLALCRKADSASGPPPGAQLGAAPTRTDELLSKAGEELAPHTTDARLRASAQWIFGTAATLGTVLTVFGAADADAIADSLPDAVWSAAALLVSLVLAGLALVPVPGRVNLDDVIDIRRYYARVVRVRGVLVVAAATLFAVAFGLTAIPMLKTATAEEDPTAEIVATVATPAKADAKPTLAVTVSGSELPDDAVARITVAAGGATLARVNAIVDSGGDLAAKTAVPVDSVDTAATVRLVVRDGDAVELSRSVTVGG